MKALFGCALVGTAAWLCGLPPAHAVPQGQISFTAEVVCAFRAIAAQHMLFSCRYFYYNHRTLNV